MMRLIYVNGLLVPPDAMRAVAHPRGKVVVQVSDWTLLKDTLRGSAFGHLSILEMNLGDSCRYHNAAPDWTSLNISVPRI